MFRLFVCLAVAVAYIPCCFGQNARVEVFGGYSYLNIDTNDLSSRQNANGWRAAVSVNASRHLAIEGDVGGAYKNYSVDLSGIGLGTVNTKVSDYAYLGGPRVNFKPFFVHGLVGVDHLTKTALGFSQSHNGLAAAFGAGFQWKIAEHWAVQGSGDYVLTRHNIFSKDRMTQNNVRASAGIVYSFGGKGQVSPVVRQQERLTKRPTQEPSTAGSIQIPSLQIESSTGEHGASVSAVMAGGVADRAGIRLGDVITEVGGKPVASSQELAAICTAMGTAPVKVRYLVRGYWQAEATVQSAIH